MPKLEAISIRVRGLVQGVGFRPHVWRLANDAALCGDVCNDGEGVLIRLFGPRHEFDPFVARLRSQAPPLSRIDEIIAADLPGFMANSFQIVASKGGAVQTGVIPDAATCPACLAEVRDPTNRRFGYAFTNCTHCGPRLSIINAIPYDRANTAMATFTMCSACQAEYDEPADRRFHTQPNACADCGPVLWLQGKAGGRLAGDPIFQAAQLIKQGCIIAIKGLGGYQLACDATNETAVAQLRQRKRRFDKPFALLAGNVAVANEYVVIDGDAQALLERAAAPIVVLDQRKELAPSVAPGQDTLGFMLPSTPLHHLLMDNLDAPIVLTSGNRSDEPQAIDNDDALDRLGDIADYWLMHDRHIVNRLDDTVLRHSQSVGTLTLRRARGYAPAPLPLPPGFDGAPAVLAMGGELKNTFCVLNEGRAIVSQHMGDLEDPATHADYRKNIELYGQLYAFMPDVIATDNHPNYLSTQWGQSLAGEVGATPISVQHHHAHMAAVMAEHGLARDHAPVLGVALDGLGYGDDGALWGSEFLRADYAEFDRLAHFAPVPLLGGERAMVEPWRNTYAHLCRALEWNQIVAEYGDVPIVATLCAKPIAQLDAMLAKGLNSPAASSAGRLFDAVAAAVGLHVERTSYEGQAAIALEGLAKRHPGLAAPYRVTANSVIEWEGLWRGILDDLKNGAGTALIAARFHQTLVSVIVECCANLATEHSLATVVLSGGVFQNTLLLAGVRDGLSNAGLRVLIPRQLPANDGGLALGQAVVAAARALA